MNAKKPGGEDAATLETLARQWGAQHIPFTSCQEAWLATSALRQATQRLDQHAALRSVLLLHGPNGVGKSALVARWIHGLNARLFVPLVFTQASLSASSLLGSLCMKLGKGWAFRRERQLQYIEEAFAEMEGRIPLVILDEAQNYNHGTLEEVRLLLGLNLPAQPAFALTLIGDQYLLSSLKLRNHRALYSRLGAQISLEAWSAEESVQALHAALRAAGLSTEVLEAAAAQQLAAAGAGLPRSLQLLARASWIQAAQSGAQSIGPDHVQAALELVPHVPGLSASMAPSENAQEASIS
jgi:type II secretory pathway predicted ATPase ExeA